MDYKETATNITGSVVGKGNTASVAQCTTRLRLVLKKVFDFFVIKYQHQIIKRFS